MDAQTASGSTGSIRPPVRRRSTGAVSSNHSHYFPRLTGYRFFVILLTAGFGLSKAKLSYEGQSTAPNTLDWMYGVCAFLLLYWLGIYEIYAPHTMPKMFEVDYLAPLWHMLSALWNWLVTVVTGRERRPMPGRRPTLEPRLE